MRRVLAGALLQLLLPLILLLSLAHGQVVNEGALQNGVGVTVAITQGDSHYWTFAVLASDPNVGSSLTDLLFVLTDSDGQTALYVSDSTGARYSSLLTAATNGLLFTNQTDPATGVLRVGATAAIAYGVYSVQVYGISSDTYTLSATLTQRTLLTSGLVTPLQGPLTSNNGSLSSSTQLNSAQYQYAQYTVTQAGPVQLSVAMTVDDVAVANAGTPLSSLVLPTIAWSSSADVTPWAQSTSAWLSSNAVIPGEPSSFSLTSAFSECSAPPCLFSFLIAPQMAMPVLPLLTITQINVSQAVPSIEANSAVSGGPNLGIGGNISYTLPTQQIAVGASQYWTFSIVDVAVSVTLTLTTPSTLSNLQLFISSVNDFPDATAAGSSWQLPQVSGQSSTSLSILPTDPFFVGAGGVTATMEGLYFVSVYAQAGGPYSLTLSMTDVTNSSAPVMALNTIYNGTLGPQSLFTYRFVCPEDSTSVTSDMVLTATGATLWVSDLTSTPGPTSSLNDITGQAVSSSLNLSVLLVERGSSQLHAGVYYIALYNPLLVPATYTVSASFTLHVVLSINQTWYSDDPLLPNQLRFFDLVQSGGTVLNLNFDLANEDVTAYGSVYMNVAQLANPSAKAAIAYPLPTSSAASVLFSIVGDGSITGDQQGNYSYTCPVSQYVCLWQVAVFCPPDNVNGMQNYSLTLTQGQLSPIITPLTAGTNLTVVRPAAGFGANVVQEFFFTVPSFSNVSVGVLYQNGINVGTNQLTMQVTRLPVLGFQQVAEFQANAFALPNPPNTTAPANNATWYSATVFFTPTNAAFKPAGTAANVGSSEIATWYVLINCAGSASCRTGTFNYTLWLSVTDYITSYNSTYVVSPANSSCSSVVSSTSSWATSPTTNFTAVGNRTTTISTSVNTTSSTSCTPLYNLTSLCVTLNQTAILNCTATNVTTNCTSIAVTSTATCTVTNATTVTNLTTTSVPTLVHVELNRTTASVAVVIPRAVYAYYQYTVPVIASGTQDLMFAATMINTAQLSIPATNGGFLMYASLTPYPSQQSNPPWLTPLTTTPQSLIFSPETYTVLPGQTLYLSLFNPSGATIVVNLTASLTTRAILTPAQTSQYFSRALGAGAAVLFELDLPGTANPTAYVSNSFVGSVTLSSADSARVTMPPFITWTSWTLSTGTDVLPSLGNLRGAGNAVTYAPKPTGGYTSGDYMARTSDVCSLPTCVYYFLVVFPQGVNSGFTWTLSAFNSSTSGAASTFASTQLPLNYTSGTLTIGEGQVQVYSLQVPNALILTSSITITVTPEDANCNPDVAATYANSNTGAFNLPMFNLNQAPNFGNARVQAYSTTGPNAVTINSTVAGLTYSTVLYSTYWFQVTGTVGGSFQLSVLTTVSALSLVRALPLSLNPATGNYTASGAVAGTTYSIALPTPVPTNMDLFITMYTAAQQPGGAQAGNPLGNTGGGVGFVACMDVLPPNAGTANVLPTNLCQQSTNARQATAVVFNSGSTPSLQSGSTIYIYIIQGNPYTVTISYRQRQTFTLGGTSSGYLRPGQAQALTLSIPAVQVGGQWSTNANFVAAVDALSTQYKPSAYLYLDVSSDLSTPVPFSTSVIDGSRGFYDRSSTVAQAGQSITVTDLCLQPTCLYTAVIYAPYALNYSFEFQALSASYQTIVPGFPTAPVYIATNTFAYYTFTLPHSAMTATVTLQSLLTGAYTGASTNADLFVSWVYPYPDYNSYNLASLTDTAYGTDAVTVNFLNVTTGTGANRTYYVAVYGQRGGYYTVGVTAQDPPPAPMFITNNQPLSSAITSMQSDYYTYNIGQVTNITDLSLVLTSSTPNPALYATFSYTHPGPVYPSVTLPALLPYEMYSRVSASLTEPGWLGASVPSTVNVQQVTLTSSLSSSNVLPLQSQTTLFVSVFGGFLASNTSSAVSSPYSLSVSLSKRITLTTTSGLLSSWATFTPVSGGTVQYYQMTWKAAALAPGSGAIIAVSGTLASVDQQLPFVYLNDPTLSTQVDPVMSSSRSYTASLINSTNTNSRMYDATTLCPTGWTSCWWKVLVYAAVDTPGYTIAVNTYQAGDQTPLYPNPNAPVSVGGFVWAANFNFFAMNVSAAMLPLTVMLRTVNQDGNMDLYASSTYTHPSAATASMQSLNINNATEFITITTAGTWYLGLFGQQTSQYSIVLSVPLHSSSAISSSAVSSSILSSSRFSSSPVSSSAVSSSAVSSSPVSSSAVSSSVFSSSPASSSVSSSVFSSSIFSSSVFSSSLFSSSPVSSSISSSVFSSSPLVTSSPTSVPASTAGSSDGAALSSTSSSSTDMRLFIAVVVPLAVIILVLCLIICCMRLAWAPLGAMTKRKEPRSPQHTDTTVVTNSMSPGASRAPYQRGDTSYVADDEKEGGVELEALPDAFDARAKQAEKAGVLHSMVEDSDMTEEGEEGTPSV